MLYLADNFLLGVAMNLHGLSAVLLVAGDQWRCGIVRKDDTELFNGLVICLVLLHIQPSPWRKWDEQGAWPTVSSYLKIGTKDAETEELVSQSITA